MFVSVSMSSIVKFSISIGVIRIVQQLVSWSVGVAGSQRAVHLDIHLVWKLSSTFTWCVLVWKLSSTFTWCVLVWKLTLTFTWCVFVWKVIKMRNTSKDLDYEEVLEIFELYLAKVNCTSFTLTGSTHIMHLVPCTYSRIV